MEVNRLKYWVQAQTQETRWKILVAGLLVCLGLWYFLWENYYHHGRSVLEAKLLPLEQKINALQSQNAQAQKLIQDPLFKKKQQQLHSQLNELNQQLNAASTHVASSADMVKALKSIVMESPGVTLLSLENTGNYQLKEGGGITGKMYRHDFVILIEGAYLPTLTYLQRLEQLPWKFYWDSMNYEVNTYPRAQITLKLHTINADEKLMNPPEKEGS